MSEFEGHNPFAPPQAVVADVPAGGVELAERSSRLAAVIGDSLISCAVIFGLAAALGGPILPSADTPHPVLQIYRMYLPGYALLAVLQGWFLYTSGQTLGKKMVHIRIVRADGSRVSFPRVFFGRAGCPILVTLIPYVGNLISFVDVLLIFRKSRRCLHDQIFDTLVVTAASSPGATLAGRRAILAAESASL